MHKDALLNKRKEFFQSIREALLRPPGKIDDFLNQSKYYIKPNDKDMIIDAEQGDFALKINGSFHNVQFEIWYSVWQLGNMIKIGIAIYDNRLQDAFINDDHHEIKKIWGNDLEPSYDIEHEGVLCEWNFSEPNLYDDYKNQEFYILGMRHLHFRVMRILFDHCKLLAAEEALRNSVKNVMKDLDTDPQ